jgi:AcrR family transcriptional regulator
MPPDQAKRAEIAAEPPLDGRVRRGQDNRARIVAAMLELIRAGDVSPGAEAVAARADVGLRTVFRHFKDMDSLYSEMSEVIFGELRGAADTPFVAQDWKGRVLELVARRAFGFEKIAPFRRAADAQRHGSRFLNADHARFVAAQREIVRREVPSEVAQDTPVFEALDLLLSYETWSRLRREQELSPRQAREVLEGLVRRVIA